MNKKRGKRNHHCGTTIDFVCGETPFARWNVDDFPTTKKKKKKKKKPFLSFFFRDDVNDVNDGDAKEDFEEAQGKMETRTSGAHIRLELTRTIADVQVRGLKNAHKWAAEQLCGLAPTTNEETGDVDEVASKREKETITFPVPIGDVPYRGGETSDATETRCTTTTNEGRDDPTYILAKSYFDLGEYRRCAHLLATSSPVSAHGKPLKTFLELYALFLAGETTRRDVANERAKGPTGAAGDREEGQKGNGTDLEDMGGDDFERNEGTSTSGPRVRGELVGRMANNPELDVVQSGLDEYEKHNNSTCAFICYLQALVFRERGRVDAAKVKFAESTRLYPTFWNAWQALVDLCDEDDVANLRLPRDHWCYQWFIAEFNLESQKNLDAMNQFVVVASTFPRSASILTKCAIAQYNLREFDEAEEMFERVIQVDPHRIEGIDAYSNILYVKEDFAKLAHLAHRISNTNKYTPETCCVIGNYYSLKQQHEKAVTYFLRALRLNRDYLSAWTLLGHEYTEMKNPKAAIEAYRCAVDINPKDYRAWYGLGQMYELISMHVYAVYYYQTAAKLRPNDSRMWCAIGACYESDGLRQPMGAIRVYQRAVECGDNEGIALGRLAKLHEKQKNWKAAAHYHLRNLERLKRETGSYAETQDSIDGLLFLAKYYKVAGKFGAAEEACSKLLDFQGPEKQTAKALLREIRSATTSDYVRNPISME